MYRRPELCWESSHWSAFAFVDRSLDLFPPHSVCVAVCVCLCTEQSFPWERSEENGQGPHFLFLWDGCRHGTGGHKGDLIHHGENSLELSASVSGHHVIKRFLTKFIWGRETWGGPFKRHLSRLNKVHGASSKFILWLIYFCATLNYFSHESHEVWFIFLHYKKHYLFIKEPVEKVITYICLSTIMR